jgi:tRNA(His) 5'-end guanylyltransferase
MVFLFSFLFSIYFQFKVALDGNFVCLDYQSLKDYFSKTTKWKLNILVSMCFWNIALDCKLNFIFQNQFNQKLCNIMRKKIEYALIKNSMPRSNHTPEICISSARSNYSLQNHASEFWYKVSFICYVIQTVKANPSILFPISKRHKYF